MHSRFPERREFCGSFVTPSSLSRIMAYMSLNMCSLFQGSHRKNLGLYCTSFEHIPRILDCKIYSDSFWEALFPRIGFQSCRTRKALNSVEQGQTTWSSSHLKWKLSLLRRRRQSRWQSMCNQSIALRLLFTILPCRLITIVRGVSLSFTTLFAASSNKAIKSLQVEHIEL
jgi:hypothetical protein